MPTARTRAGCRTRRRCSTTRRSFGATLAQRDRDLDVTPGCYARVEMDAAVWTAIGLLAAMSLGTLFCLGARIDSLAAKTDARFDNVDARFDRVDAGFDALIARMDA